MSGQGEWPAASQTASEAAGFVLAGGRSSRMGRDKALVQFASQPMVAHALETLRQAGLSPSIAGGQAELAAFAPLVPDINPGLGPLGGICAALASTSAQLAVFLPVDLPLLPTSLVLCLLRHAAISGNAVTLPSINGFTQTFPAVLDRSLAPLLERELATGNRGCFSAFQAVAAAIAQSISVLPVEILVQSGQVSHPQSLPASRWFLNVNSEEELRWAVVHSRARIA